MLWQFSCGLREFVTHSLGLCKLVATAILVFEQCWVFSLQLIVLKEVGLGVEITVSGCRYYLGNLSGLLGGNGSRKVCGVASLFVSSEALEEMLAFFSLWEGVCWYVWFLNVVIAACAVAVVEVTLHTEVTQGRSRSLNCAERTSLHWRCGLVGDVETTVVIMDIHISASAIDLVIDWTSHPNRLLREKIRRSATKLLGKIVVRH